MAYTQKFGRPAVTNKVVDEITSGYQNGGDKKKKVKSFDNETKETSSIDVVSGSPADKLSKQVGNAIDFGSQSQSTSGKKGDLTSGTNANTMASASTYGNLPKGFKGRAFDKSNKIVDFSNSNQDKRRGEKFRVYK
mgnify:FL=1|tara:strand:+ start:302 stop:709 length:408 start_codon:yes stop_codon:yes gene_type:complete